ncbi:unnamed protein product [Lactuca saligna]|uniref:Uncharacterized protein n=1 Tax=Lactuca saligna TaxID=75948 RepID=A0AA35ZI46_LACSI|nr:unnamed protein product [Lactuca saligna]
MIVIGGDTFDGTTMTIIGGGSVASIATATSLAVPEKRRQLQAEEVGATRKNLTVKKMVKKFKRPHSDWKICVKVLKRLPLMWKMKKTWRTILYSSRISQLDLLQPAGVDNW